MVVGGVVGGGVVGGGVVGGVVGGTSEVKFWDEIYT